ncbi:uncharacterized protein EI97DRAFT_471511 [Westerdykella ornata]|uniref:Uncharacterized protein n=1 Tax=Westerdykella ornata TaxID=318751 RepID=A0A6A6JWN1_WESOR|nr:uncharacterized protein EI97DRAFT_471511 [Westerdykella ornata]KAF2280635.1 hypothetical protein EI97DRAFT_471511 [Westerdykella ornata]
MHWFPRRSFSGRFGERWFEVVECVAVAVRWNASTQQQQSALVVEENATNTRTHTQQQTARRREMGSLSVEMAVVWVTGKGGDGGSGGKGKDEGRVTGDRRAGWGFVIGGKEKKRAVKCRRKGRRAEKWYGLQLPNGGATGGGGQGQSVEGAGGGAEQGPLAGLRSCSRAAAAVRWACLGPPAWKALIGGGVRLSMRRVAGMSAASAGPLRSTTRLFSPDSSSRVPGERAFFIRLGPASGLKFDCRRWWRGRNGLGCPGWHGRARMTSALAGSRLGGDARATKGSHEQSGKLQKGTWGLQMALPGGPMGSAGLSSASSPSVPCSGCAPIPISPSPRKPLRVQRKSARTGTTTVGPQDKELPAAGSISNQRQRQPDSTERGERAPDWALEPQPASPIFAPTAARACACASPPLRVSAAASRLPKGRERETPHWRHCLPPLAARKDQAHSCFTPLVQSAPCHAHAHPFHLPGPCRRTINRKPF